MLGPHHRLIDTGRQQGMAWWKRWLVDLYWPEKSDFVARYYTLGPQHGIAAA